MDPADIRVIRRLSERVNVLPIIARADVLTDEKLAAVRKAIRRDLNDAKLSFGVFGPIKVEEVETRDSGSNIDSSTTGSIDSSHNPGSQSDEGIGAEESDDDDIDTPAAVTGDAIHANVNGETTTLGTDERRARPVIKLNPKHRAPTRSTSRSRLGLSERGSDLEDKRAPIPLAELATPGAEGETTLAAVRFSAGWLAGHAPREMGDAMPLAVVMPETPAGGSLRVRARALKPAVVAPLRPVSAAYSVESASSRPGSVYARSPGAQSVAESQTGVFAVSSPGGEATPVSVDHGSNHIVNGGDEDEDRGTPTPTASVRRAPSVDHFPPPTPTHAYHPNGHTHSHNHGPFQMHYEPRDLRGVFVRRFRWGCVDVLNPEHCDFAALRTTVLSTHLKVLKLNTKEVLYEKYRTEKLLARRATRNISEEERKRLLQGE